MSITINPITANAVTINLRDFYSWYTHDEFVEVPEEIAAELTADKNYHKAHDRRMRRNKAYSLDFETDMEAAALVLINDSPEAIFAMKERYCRLCQAGHVRQNRSAVLTFSPNSKILMTSPMTKSCMT